MSVVDEGAEHGEDRGDAAAAADQDQVVGPLIDVGDDEVALGRRQADHHPGACVGDEVATDPPGRVGLDGELEQAVGVVGRAGEAEGPLVHDPVDLHADHHVLAGPEALPGGVGAEAQGDGSGGLAPDGDHLGPHLTHRPPWVDELQVAVDAVRCAQAVDEVRGQGPPHDRHVALLVG